MVADALQRGLSAGSDRLVRPTTGRRQAQMVRGDVTARAFRRVGRRELAQRRAQATAAARKPANRYSCRHERTEYRSGGARNQL